MAVKLVLILSVIAQLTAAGLALRLNKLYRRRSAWILISAAAILMTIGRLTSLVSTWGKPMADTNAEMTLWTESLIALLVSVVLVAGIALIEPLFVELHEAEQLLKREKRQLEQVVRHNEDELRVARQIQEDLLPAVAPKIDNFDIAGASCPAEWTSGDYFDYFPIQDGSLAVVIADVSGHGVGPALLMSETRAYLRALAQTRNGVGEILTLANRSIAQDMDMGQFVTIFLTRLDPGSRSAVYSSAGHNGYLLRAGGDAHVLSPTGLALGIDAETVLTDEPLIDLGPADVMLLATDGITETRSPDGTMFGEERLFEVARDNRDRSASEIVEAVFEAVREFSHGAEQLDDNTAVVIKVC